MKPEPPRYSAQFQAEVALAALAPDAPMHELQARYRLPAATILQWKAELVAKAYRVFLDAASYARHLRPQQLVRLRCSGPVPFADAAGYVGEVTDEDFEFREVLNPYEHFSNVSDPPVLRTHRIRLADVVDLRVDVDLG